MKSIIKYLDKNTESEIIRLYTDERFSGDRLGKMFGYSESTVYKILDKNNIQRRNVQGANRKHDLNFSYFKKIDSEEKAYILGLLYADGCNMKTGFNITLQEGDKDILEKVKHAIGYESELSLKIRNEKNWKNCLSLTIYSVEIAKDLVQLGCPPNKSLILKFPTEGQVPRYLWKPFIRGYFDGDGSIFYSKNWYACFCGTKEFLGSIQDFLYTELDFIPVKLLKCKPDNSCNNYQFRVGGNKKALTFFNWLYNDSSIYLERKFKKYQEFIKYYTLKISTIEEHRVLLRERVCSNNCDEKVFTCGLCKNCYQRQWRDNLKIKSVMK